MIQNTMEYSCRLFVEGSRPMFNLFQTCVEMIYMVIWKVVGDYENYMNRIRLKNIPEYILFYFCQVLS